LKRKIHKILGVTLTLVMVLTLAVAFSPIPALASPDEEAWEVFPDMPVVGLAGDFFMDTTITGMGPFAKASDGTLYLYVAGLADLYKSEDDGRTWEVTNFGADLAAIPIAAAGQIITDIACSSEDPDILYVSCGDATAADLDRVYKSEDAGDEWSEVGRAAMAAFSAAWANNAEVITSIDVGYIDEKPHVYIGTADGAYNGSVYWMQDFPMGQTWEDLLITDLGAAPATGDIYTVNCSPFFEDDAEVDALITTNNYGGTGVDYTGVLRNTTSIPGDWSEQAELQLGNVTAFETLRSSDIHYVADFDDEDEMFVGVEEVTSAGLGDIFRICGTGCCLDLNIDGAGTGTDVVSLDVVGSFGSTSLVAEGFPAAAAATTIYYSTDDGDSWDEADKAPTGTGAQFNLVILDDDFADSGIAWCASDAATEGGVHLTTDFGATWNGISMIDTDMAGAVYDIAFSADYGTGDAPLFMVTEATTAADDSAWKYDGTNWERIWYDAANALDLVEVSPDYANDTAVFVADSATPTILYSFDGGADFTTMTQQPETPAGVARPITAWVVIDDETIISGAATGEVYKTTRYGRRCWDEVDLLGGGITDIAVSGDTVLVGDSTSIVSISIDGGEEYEELSDGEVATLAGANDTYVAFDADYATNDTVYAASGAFVARCEIDPDEDMADQEFDDIGALGGFAAASGLVVSEDGTLYAADATAVAGIGAAVAAVAAVPGDAFTIMATAAADTGFIQVSAGSVAVTGSGHTIAGALTTIVPGSGSVAWTLAATGDWVTFTVSAGATATYGMITIGALDTSVAVITSDDDGDARVWGGGVAGTGPFALPDCAVAAVAAATAADTTGGVNRCLNPTDDTADVVWELPLTGFAAGETLAGIGAAGTVSSLSLTAGSNILWAIDTAAAPEAIWTYEDTLAAPVILTSPGNKSSVDSEDEVAFTWEDLNVDTVEFYTLELNEYDDFSGPDLGATLIDDNEWSTGSGALDAGTTYYWRVTVTDPVSSRTSAEWSFITKVSQVTAPVEVRPLPGAQDVILLPTFAWRPVTGAATYEILVATDAGFTSVVTSATTLINAWEIDVELDYSTVYYWRVRGISASGAPAGDWVISVFTTMEKPTVTPPVEITQITQPAPIVEITKTEITPAWIWAIIAIGAVLCVAVVILIVRTRRAV